MLLSTILPVGLNSFVATFLASTPGDANSWMMRSILLYDTETGEPLIPLLKTVEPCDMHAKTDKPWLCNCKQNKRAPWKSSAREKFWAPLWGAQGQKTFFTETYGLVLDAAGVQFHAKWLERLKIRPTVEITIPPNYLYVSVDPAEGGSDEFAINVMTISRDHWVIIYMDSFQWEGGVVNYRDKHIMYCVNWLLSHKVYKQSSQVYIAENLPGNTGGMMAHLCHDVPFSITMAEVNKTDKRFGVGKTHQSTIDMILKMKNMLCEGRLVFANDMGTYTELKDGKLTDDSRQPAEMKELLLSQLAAFRWNPETRKFSGKALGGRDDTAVAAMMAPQWAPRFLESADYADFRNRTLQRCYRF